MAELWTAGCNREFYAEGILASRLTRCIGRTGGTAPATGGLASYDNWPQLLIHISPPGRSPIRLVFHLLRIHWLSMCTGREFGRSSGYASAAASSMCVSTLKNVWSAVDAVRGSGCAKRPPTVRLVERPGCSPRRRRLAFGRASVPSTRTRGWAGAWCR